MPYPHNFIKVSLLASLNGTDEVLSTSFHIAKAEGTIDPIEWVSFLVSCPGQIAGASVEFWARANSRIPNGWTLNSVKYALINTEGRYDDEDAHEEEVEPTPGGGTLGWAPQLSLVASLTSSKRKDPGRYNRMYIPTTVPDLYGGPYLKQQQQELFLVSVLDYLEAVNGILDAGLTDDYRVTVMSNTREGSALPVVAVRAGRVIDTQRRRRNKISENYITMNVV